MDLGCGASGQSCWDLGCRIQGYEWVHICGLGLLYNYGLEVKGVHSSGSGFRIPVPKIHANHAPAQWGEALQ